MSHRHQKFTTSKAKPLSFPHPLTCSPYSLLHISKWNLHQSAVQARIQNFLWLFFLSHSTIESASPAWFILNIYLDSIYSYHVVQITITSLLAYLNCFYLVPVLLLLYSFPLSKQNDLSGDKARSRPFSAETLINVFQFHLNIKLLAIPLGSSPSSLIWSMPSPLYLRAFALALLNIWKPFSQDSCRACPSLHSHLCSNVLSSGISSLTQSS